MLEVSSQLEQSSILQLNCFSLHFYQPGTSPLPPQIEKGIGKLDEIHNIDKIYCTIYNLLILTKNGNLYIGGKFLPNNIYQNNQINNKFQLFFPPNDNRKIIKISCGPEFGVIITEQNKEREMIIFGWDSKKVFHQNNNNLLLDNYITMKLPSSIQLNDKITHLECGGDFIVLVINNNEIYVMGFNPCGQLGLGHQKDVFELTKVTIDNNEFNDFKNNFIVEHVKCGIYHTFYVVKEIKNNQLYFVTCGDNRKGQLMREECVKYSFGFVNLFQSKHNTCQSIKNMVQEEGIELINTQYLNSLFLTKKNKRLFVSGLLDPFMEKNARFKTKKEKENLIYKTFEPMELKLNYLNLKHLKLHSGGWHSIIGNDNNLFGFGINGDFQLGLKQPPLDQSTIVPNDLLFNNSDFRKEFTELKEVNEMIRSKNYYYIKSIACCRDCSFILIDIMDSIFVKQFNQVMNEYIDINIIVFNNDI
ncbi:hypothetical protein ABK040_008809 [Willaertia magna]